ncbi:MAG: hydrogenase [Candidatus Aminicenantes bacterium]|nr:hydrogenase [Candidatus Aminicenantes bacterium]
MVEMEQLQKEAKEILKQGKVKFVIGYSKGSQNLTATPVFIKKPEHTSRLIWDPTCVQNLVKFIVDDKQKQSREKKPDERPVGIVVKGCDSRAINVLIQEKFIDRDDVYILGLSCEELGVVDEKKIAQKLEGKKIEKIEFAKKNNLIVSTKDGEKKIPVKDVLADRCLECKAHFPVIYDQLFGEETEREVKEPYKSIKKTESQSPKKRWDFWKEQLEKCIRCYACRSICPMCYCDECVADSINMAVTAETTAEEKAQKIKWIERSPALSENIGYHLIRAIHLAGRCIDCGECERACPVDIPLRLLNKKLEKAAHELFDYDVGFDHKKPSLISSFKDEDPEDFIR